MNKFKHILISVAVGTTATLLALWIWRKYEAKQLIDAMTPKVTEG